MGPRAEVNDPSQPSLPFEHRLGPRLPCLRAAPAPRSVVLFQRAERAHVHCLLLRRRLESSIAAVVDTALLQLLGEQEGCRHRDAAVFCGWDGCDLLGLLPHELDGHRDGGDRHVVVRHYEWLGSGVTLRQRTRRVGLLLGGRRGVGRADVWRRTAEEQRPFGLCPETTHQALGARYDHAHHLLH